MTKKPRSLQKETDNDVARWT